MQTKLVDKANQNTLISLRSLCSVFFGLLLKLAMKLTVGLVDLQVYGEEHVVECRNQGRPIIFAGWHGHNFVTMYGYYVLFRNNFKGAIMIPDSFNGMILGYFAEKLNIDVVKVNAGAGPSRWARATVSMIKLMRNGCCALLSPDGPKGPPHKVKPGIALMGQQAKAVVIPASVASTRAIRLFFRWDKHLIPLPLSRTVIRFGPPIDANPANSQCPGVEELQQLIELALAEGERCAEELCRQKTLPEGGVQ